MNYALADDGWFFFGEGEGEEAIFASKDLFFFYRKKQKIVFLMLKIESFSFFLYWVMDFVGLK